MLLRQDRALTAIAVVLDVAFHQAAGPVNGGEIAERIGQPRRGIEPLLQALSRTQVLESLRGPRGGYRLGRPARALTLAAIVHAVVEAEEAEPTGTLPRIVLVPLWRELNGLVEQRLADLTVADLIHQAEAAGLQRAAGAPPNFAI